MYLMAAAFVAPAYGVELTPSQALQRASNGGVHKVAGLEKQIDAAPVFTAQTVLGTKVAYVFNLKNDAGYYILSANDLAYPVLGYVENGDFSANDMPPAMQWWLDEYGRQIEFAESNGALGARKAPLESDNEWSPVGPLVTTKWNQDTPFNDDCPKVNGALSVTGCVATSMAQLMNYFKYPEVGEGSISYYSGSKYLKMDFSEEPFNWDNMIDYYGKGNYSEEEASAVAYLMKACGYSTKMQYSPNMSGTQGELISSALRTYFKYDGNCHSAQRLPYSWNQWSSMIYENLKNIGPVVINGSSVYGGHSFVCDGYDGNGYFHFNWGWGGVSDGWFALDALNPDAQGIGGYAGGYNFNQDVIIGAQKPTGLPVELTPSVLTQYGATIATINSQKMITFDVEGSNTLGWGNTQDHKISVKVGAIFEPINGGDKVEVSGKLGRNSVSDFEPGTYRIPEGGKPLVKAPSLADGTYKVTLASQDADKENAPWTPVIVEWSYPNYCILNVKDGVYSVENVAVPYIEISESEIEGDIYFGCNFMVKAFLENNSDIELTQGVCPVLLSGSDIKYTGQSILVTLQPGERKEMEWLSQFDSGSGVNPKEDVSFKWGLYNPQTSKMYGEYGEVTLFKTPDALRVSMSSISIENAEWESMTIKDRYFGKVFKVDNLEDFVFDLAFEVTRGYFDGQIIIDLGKINVLGQYEYEFLPIGEPVYQAHPFLKMGEAFNFTQTLSVDGSADELYAVRVQYTSGMKINSLGTIFFLSSDYNDVESILDENAEAEYFNMQGVKVDSPARGQLLIEKRGAKTRKVVF